MTPLKATLPFAFAFSVVASMASAGPERVTEEMFVATHVGNCITYTGGSDGVQCYRADGTTDYDDRTYGKDTGKWEFRDGRYCVAYSAAPNSWNCIDFVVDGDVYSYADGSYTWTIN